MISFCFNWNNAAGGEATLFDNRYVEYRVKTTRCLYEKKKRNVHAANRVLGCVAGEFYVRSSIGAVCRDSYPYRQIGYELSPIEKSALPHLRRHSFIHSFIH